MAVASGSKDLRREDPCHGVLHRPLRTIDNAFHPIVGGRRRYCDNQPRRRGQQSDSYSARQNRGIDLVAGVLKSLKGVNHAKDGAQ